MLANLPITGLDIVYAAIAALCLTMIIRNLVRIYRISREVRNRMSLGRDELRETLEKCYVMFPIDRLDFHGIILRRGMTVKITTLQDRVIEGELLGFNSSNMICIRTPGLIVAHELKNIRDIALI